MLPRHQRHNVNAATCQRCVISCTYRQLHSQGADAKAEQSVQGKAAAAAKQAKAAQQALKWSKDKVDAALAELQARAEAAEMPLAKRNRDQRCSVFSGSNHGAVGAAGSGLPELDSQG